MPSNSLERGRNIGDVATNLIYTASLTLRRIGYTLYSISLPIGGETLALYLAGLGKRNYTLAGSIPSSSTAATALYRRLANYDRIARMLDSI